MTAPPVFMACPYTLTRIAETGREFTGFAPYVASVSNDGLVAFQAALAGGGSGVFIARGGPVSTIVDRDGPFSEIISHPDINDRGEICFYAKLKSGRSAVALVRGGQTDILATDAGPLGPTMNHAGSAAFRFARGPHDSGIGTTTAAAGGSVSTIADTVSVGEYSAFHGLPVINSRDAVVFRADLKIGGQCIDVVEGQSRRRIAATGGEFTTLGAFPDMNDAGTVVFCATLARSGGTGIFAGSDGRLTTLADSNGGAFESFRGVLVNNSGGGGGGDGMIFYATPRGGSLGVFAGLDPQSHCLLSIGSQLLGSTVVDFALNPVSFNDVGQIAIRVKLADDRQLILRADPRRR